MEKKTHGKHLKLVKCVPAEEPTGKAMALLDRTQEEIIAERRQKRQEMLDRLRSRN